MAAQLPGIAIVGVDVHIGSQITDLLLSRRPSAAWPNWSRHCAPTGTP